MATTGSVEDTIAAVATPPGRGGVAIVRVSGPDAYDISRGIFRSLAGEVVSPRPRRATVGRVLDPATGEAVDEVLCLFMPGPGSYTGEDVVEFHCHGGPVPVEGVLAVLLQAGARPAEPGEFTRRAFLNGRMDLTQAEAVADLISARSRKAARLALDQMEGRLGREIRRLRSEIVEIMASVEVVLDYPELDIEARQVEELLSGSERIRKELDALLLSARTGRAYREGVRTVILGRPNVGKSSLLNALLGMDRAIVTDIPGTTRDTVEEELVVEGLPLILIDTAGIREGGDDVERLGVERARAAVERAELVLVVLDESDGLTPEDREIIEGIGHRRHCIYVLNKIDRDEAKLSPGDLRALGIEAPVVRISALSGYGIEELSANIARTVLGSDGAHLLGDESLVITSARHQEALRNATASLSSFAGALRMSFPVDVASIDLREAAEHLGTITGETVTDDLLDRIFANYCVGK